MGVRGFSKWVNSRVSRFFDRTQLAEEGDARLLFDASAFAFWVLQSVENEAQVAGDYAAIEAETTRLVEELLEKHHVEAWFVLDGPEQSNLKQEEKSDRRRKQFEKLSELNETTKTVTSKKNLIAAIKEAQLQAVESELLAEDIGRERVSPLDEEYLSDFELVDLTPEQVMDIIVPETEEFSIEDVIFDSNELPPPPMFLDAVFGTLADLSRKKNNLRVFQAKGEADVALAQMCRDSIASDKPRCYICSNDSDFYFTQKVQFVPLGSLDFVDCSGTVFTSDALAACLDITEDQLIELAVGIGTDYTKKRYLKATGIDKLLKRIKANPGALFTTAGTNDREAAGLEYSLAVFRNLVDASVTPFESLRVPSGRALLPSELPEDSTVRDLLEKERFLLHSCQQDICDRTSMRLLNDHSADLPTKVSRAAKLELLSIFPEYQVVFDQQTETVSYWTAYSAAFLFQVIEMIILRSICANRVPPSKLYDAKDFFPSKKHNQQPLQEEPPSWLTSENSKGKGGTEETEETENEGNVELPVDSYKEEIWDSVKRNRVTVLTAETGAGKSSRVPFILLEKYPRATLIVSQPRRVAAKSLYKRAKSVLGDDHALVGLRMGGGIREEVQGKCQLRYVTTGYLVRYLAARVEDLDDLDFLILDEIHERSIDMDILCRLAKALLEKNSRVRLLLMSATMEASAFAEYFGVSDKPMFIGAKRFEYKEIFAKDIEPVVPVAGFAKAKEALLHQLGKESAQKAPSIQLRKAQYHTCIPLIRSYHRKTKSVLVFVSGITDINVLYEELHPFEKDLKIIAMHSSIPLEEQEEAWKDTGDGRLKVILATNTAESSITLPDLDVVICFGTAKKNQYDAQTRANTLVETWISKASAIQRAGRTGRLREGTVYRLYSEEVFKSMRSHDPPEILESSLENAVVLAKGIFKDKPIRPWLEGLIDPPDDKDVRLSIDYLALVGVLTGPTDEGSKLSSLGEFVASLPLDVTLSLLVTYGAMLGCLSEAVGLAAIFSLDKSPFKRASTIHHTPDEYNEIILLSKQTEWDLSGGLFSEPLAVLRLLSLWNSIGMRGRNYLTCKKNVRWPTMSHLAQVHKFLVGDIFRGRFGASLDSLELDPPDRLFKDPRRLNRLRFLLFLSCKSNIVRITQQSLQSGLTSSFGGYFRHNLQGINAQDLSKWYSSILVDSTIKQDSLKSVLPSSSRWFSVHEKTHVKSFFLQQPSTQTPHTEESSMEDLLLRVPEFLGSRTRVPFIIQDEKKPTEENNDAALTSSSESQTAPPIRQGSALLPAHVRRKLNKKKKSSMSAVNQQASAPVTTTQQQQQAPDDKREGPCAAILMATQTRGTISAKQIYQLWSTRRLSLYHADLRVAFVDNDKLVDSFKAAFPELHVDSLRDGVCIVELESEEELFAVKDWMRITIRSWAELFCVDIYEQKSEVYSEEESENYSEEESEDYSDSDENDKTFVETRHFVVGKNWNPTRAKLEAIFQSKIVRFESLQTTTSHDQILLIENEYCPEKSEFRTLPFGAMGLGFLKRQRKDYVEFCELKGVGCIETVTKRTIALPTDFLPKVVTAPKVSIPVSPHVKDQIKPIPRSRSRDREYLYLDSDSLDDSDFSSSSSEYDSDDDYLWSDRTAVESNFCLLNPKLQPEVRVHEQSICGLASHLGEEKVELFAVANSLVLMSKTRASVSSLSVLPPGTDWLTKALACIGGKLSGEDMTSVMCAETHEVGAALVSLREIPRNSLLKPNRKAIAALDKLFHEYKFVPSPLPEEYSSLMEKRASVTLLKRGEPIPDSMKPASPRGSPVFERPKANAKGYLKKETTSESVREKPRKPATEQPTTKGKATTTQPASATITKPASDTILKSVSEIENESTKVAKKETAPQPAREPGTELPRKTKGRWRPKQSSTKPSNPSTTTTTGRDISLAAPPRILKESLRDLERMGKESADLGTKHRALTVQLQVLQDEKQRVEEEKEALDRRRTAALSPIIGLLSTQGGQMSLDNLCTATGLESQREMLLDILRLNEDYFRFEHNNTVVCLVEQPNVI